MTTFEGTDAVALAAPPPPSFRVIVCPAGRGFAAAEAEADAEADADAGAAVAAAAVAAGSAGAVVAAPGAVGCPSDATRLGFFGSAGLAPSLGLPSPSKYASKSASKAP